MRRRPASAKPKETDDDLSSVAQARLNRPLKQHSRGRRPRSAATARPQGIQQIRELRSSTRVTPTATKGSSASRKYLKQTQFRKRQEKMLFEQELEQDQQEYEKKIELKVAQANRLCIELGLNKRYELVGEQKGITLVRLITTAERMKRHISADVFLREFEKLATPAHRDAILANESEKSIRAEKKSTMKGHQKLSKKEIQEELRAVLQDTAQLTLTLTQQLGELQRKGWNSS